MNRRNFLLGGAAVLAAPMIPAIPAPVRAFAKETGSISGTILNITDISSGVFRIGDEISGRGLSEGTNIIGFSSSTLTIG